MNFQCLRDIRTFFVLLCCCQPVCFRPRPCCLDGDTKFDFATSNALFASDVTASMTSISRCTLTRSRFRRGVGHNSQLVCHPETQTYPCAHTDAFHCVARPTNTPVWSSRAWNGGRLRVTLSETSGAQRCRYTGLADTST